VLTSEFAGGALAPWLNLPEALLRETGLFLIVYARAGRLARRAAFMPKPLVVIVIAGNAGWTLASIALLFSGAVTPNLLGERLSRSRRLRWVRWPSCQYSACAGASRRWRPEIVRARSTRRSNPA